MLDNDAGRDGGETAGRDLRSWGMLDGLAVTTLAEFRPMVVFAADHPLATRRSIPFASLRGEPYLMLEEPGSRTYFEELLADHDLAPVVFHASSSLEAVRSAVAAGFRFTVLVMRPPSSTTYDGRAVKTLTIQDDVRPLRIVLASRNAAHPGKLLKQFTDHATAYFEAACHHIRP